MRTALKIIIILSIIITYSCKSGNNAKITVIKENDKTENKTEKLIIIEGKISVKGSEPHTYLALTTADRTVYAITGTLKKELTGLQNKTVKLEGIIIKEAIGPGFPAEFSAVKIISIN